MSTSHPASPESPAAPLCLHPLQGGVCQVLDAQGRPVGVLKLIAGRWKFKGLGFDEQGNIVPGGGPLTHRHNMVFERLDEEELNARLLGA